MSLPFSSEQFFRILAQYNEAVWPFQLVLFAGAVACVGATFLQRGLDRAVGWALAMFWAWMGIAYHLVFFTRINLAAWGFGVAFLVAAGLFAWHAKTGRLRFEKPAGATGVASVTLISYALVVYPSIGWLLGHVYPRMPTFGLPCPTTILTLGLLLLARRPVSLSLFVVPIAWSVVGTVAALELGVIEDFGLLAAAIVTVIVMVSRVTHRHAPGRRIERLAE